MPGFNRTGPMREGPGTGRGLGRCRNRMTTAADRETVGPDKSVATTLPKGGPRLRLRGGQEAGRCRCRGKGRRPRRFER